MAFGIRGPGGNRTGSVVAVAMSSPPVRGVPRLPRGLTVSVASTSRTAFSRPGTTRVPVDRVDTKGMQALPRAPFDNELGLVFTELSPDVARAQLEVQPKLLQPMGIVHGGVYCSMVESMASNAAYTWFNANGGGGGVVGVNNNTDFLRAIGSGTVYGTATPLHRGRRQQLWLVTITDADDRMVARGQVRLQNLEEAPAGG